MAKHQLVRGIVADALVKQACFQQLGLSSKEVIMFHHACLQTTRAHEELQR